MSVFMGFMLGVLVGATLGGIGMFLMIKETQMDLAAEEPNVVVIKELHRDNDFVPAAHCKAAPAPELDWENELEEPLEEVKYGDF